MERTLILIKPDAMQRGLAGEIITRFERRGLRMVAMRLLKVDKAMAKKHYGEHVGKPFFDGLVDYITSSPIIAAVFEGTNAVAACRNSFHNGSSFVPLPVATICSITRSGANRSGIS